MLKPYLKMIKKKYRMQFEIEVP